MKEKFLRAPLVPLFINLFVEGALLVPLKIYNIFVYMYFI